jgi:hypothetical protein
MHREHKIGAIARQIRGSITQLGRYVEDLSFSASQTTLTEEKKRTQPAGGASYPACKPYILL